LKLRGIGGRDRAATMMLAMVVMDNESDDVEVRQRRNGRRDRAVIPLWR
jgi:hypothetical protein